MHRRRSRSTRERASAVAPSRPTVKSEFPAAPASTTAPRRSSSIAARWEVCEDARFQGRCVVLRRGSYDSLRGLGMENRISSVRRVDDKRRYDNEVPYSLAHPNYEHRRIPNERLREVPVTSARAVMGPPEQRCWVERTQVGERRDLNVPGAIIGGVLGGILGHQVGGGTGKTVATIGGAVGGGALGANIDRIRDPQSGQEVRRCETVAGQTPQYWDVTYNYQGVQHHVQMTTQPGPTIAVNNAGRAAPLDGRPRRLRRQRAALAGRAARDRQASTRGFGGCVAFGHTPPVANSGLDPWRWAAGGIRSHARAVLRPAASTAPKAPRRCHHRRRQRRRSGRSRPRPRPPRHPASAVPDAEPAAPVDVALSDPQRIEFFRWIVGVPPIAGTSGLPDLVVQHLMERLDEVIASDTLRAGLLPRAPHVIPQLMKTLRDEGYSSVDVASRISKDVVLTAEVVRSATSAFQRGDDEERDRPPARGDDDRHPGPAPGDRQRRPAADLRCQGRHLLGARRDPDLEGRRPQGAPVRRARDAADRRPVRRLPRRPAAQHRLDGAAARDRRLRGHGAQRRAARPPRGRPATAATPRRPLRRDRRALEPERGGRRARRRRRPQRRRRRAIAARAGAAPGRPAGRLARAHACGPGTGARPCRPGRRCRSRCGTATPASRRTESSRRRPPGRARL